MSVLKDQQELMQAEQRPVIDGPYDLQVVGRNTQQDSSVDEDANHRFHRSEIAWIPEGLKIKGSIETEEDSVSIDIGGKTEEETFDPPEDGIKFRLSNSGGGPAKKFRLWTHLIVHEGSYRGMWARSPLKRIDRYSLHEYADNIIQPGVQDMTFQGQVLLKIQDEPKGDEEISDFATYTFSEGVQKIAKDGPKEIEVITELRYKDTFEDPYENQFFSHRAVVSQDMDWRDFVQKDAPTVQVINESAQQQSMLEKLCLRANSLINRLSRLRRD